MQGSEEQDSGFGIQDSEEKPPFFLTPHSEEQDSGFRGKTSALLPESRILILSCEAYELQRPANHAILRMPIWGAYPHENKKTNCL
jgi:hypothetical protein